MNIWERQRMELALSPEDRRSLAVYERKKLFTELTGLVSQLTIILKDPISSQYLSTSDQDLLMEACKAILDTTICNPTS